MIKYYMIMIFSVLIASFSQLLLKISANKTHSSFFKQYLNFEVIAGYFLLFCSTVLTIIAYKKIDYKNGPVLESLGYIFVLLLCKLFLKEKINSRRIIGILTIILGITVFYI